MALGFRHALVTGGGTGIGRAIAEALAAQGAEVTICGRRLEALEKVAAGNSRIHPVAADVTDETSVSRLYEVAQAARGRFDVVIANAGMAASSPAHRTTLDLWQQMIDVNLTGAFLAVRPAVASMRKAGRGRIVFIASIAGLKGAPYISAYVASKHGVVGLTRALAAELAKTGATANAVCPGFTGTEIVADAIATISATTGRSEEEAVAELTRFNPQGRLITPDEVANTVLWLCLPESDSINGQSIAVAGGEVT